MKTTYWIWYPGDFELYHAMKQNFSRVERGYGWPAFWKSEGFRNRVAFRRTYQLEKETAFTVYSDAVGFVLAGENKYPFGKTITCGPGEVSISVHAGCIEAFPSIYVEGEVICSDKGWLVEDYENPLTPVGKSRYFTRKDQNPTVWEYSEKEYLPVEETEINGGVLFGFETELTAVLQVAYTKGYQPLRICCGESKEEALDEVHCYYSWEPDEKTGCCPCCAVRYAFIPGIKKGDVHLTARHQYVDIPVRAKFHCDDEKLNAIWDVAEHTFRLCSGIFFIDGVKRDKWIWSGDAYQSLFVNQYLLADPDIDQRTLLALRGNDPMTPHINTIMDYSLFWILGVKKHYEAYGDLDFVKQVYPKMCSLMAFCEKQTEEHGFIVGREKDWVYIDWADMDKEGPVCAEQMLYAACFQTMEEISAVLGEDGTVYHDRYMQLKTAIPAFFWDEEKGAFIDSYVSGKRHVTRHANIFAILYDIADGGQQEKIVEHVINNPAIAAITTPYFNFFALDMMCRIGKYQDVFDTLHSYWGGMLDRGAVTFWEEYDPKVPESEQYDMYGDRFGKSLCHAWSASPIYFLAKYFMGLSFEKDAAFVLRPQLSFFSSFTCTLPAGAGKVEMTWDGSQLNVFTDVTGGRIVCGDRTVLLEAGKMVSVK